MSEAKPCEFLSWDSQHFKKRIARISCKPTDVSAWKEALAFCRDENIDCAYLLLDADDVEGLRIAVREKFFLADIRLEMEKNLRTMADADRESFINVRNAKADDLDSLKKLAAKSHTNTRFYKDGNFDSQACDELYSLWIEKEFNDEEIDVLVAEDSETVCGYISCRKTTKSDSQIGLLAVDENFRGRGLGQMLVTAVFDKAVQDGCLRLNTVTQGASVPAQRLYQSCGFRTSAVKIWMHRWFV